jgi:hypothetical protein
MSHKARACVLPLLLSLGALPLSGCLLVAGAGVGYVVSQQVLPNDIHVAEVADDGDTVWKSVRQSMLILVDPGHELEILDVPRSIKCKVDGASVTVEVEVFDLDRTNIRVHAEKYLSADNETTNEVMDTILRRLQDTD